MQRNNSLKIQKYFADCDSKWLLTLRILTLVDMSKDKNIRLASNKPTNTILAYVETKNVQKINESLTKTHRKYFNKS
jgi:hypothetical protein